ncbi:MAG TPA: hypothetical protein ENH05_02105 [Rhizobiales bacterium]|nr:hypothetical protein BMS3Bbin10_00669 [bacterium BMS3Bbin10]HDO51510.1 hypothetical protein [Hyphomicrobiales bacterium]
MGWQRYWKWLTGALIGLALFLGGVIWIVDPYDSLPFSPPLERMPLAQNQRYSYPAIARNPVFDSIVIGTSTMRLLRPDALNEALDARFANLSMNSATAYEQARILEVFARRRPAPKYAIIGLDVVWCTIGESQPKYTFRRFPEWMYDANPWNDIPNLLEFKTFEVAGRQAGYLLGLRKARYGADGYANFLPPPSEYNLEKARKSIYRAAGPRRRDAPAAPPPGIEKKRASWSFPSHALLEGVLNALPGATRKILVFVPYHQFRQPPANTVEAARWRECKARITAMARRHANTTVLDFMIPSPITARDENYWDSLHTTNAIADRLVELIARGAGGRSSSDSEYVILGQGQ